MTVSRTTPVGAPCWIDLTSSDADRARTFYCGLFGWEAEQPDERFGGSDLSGLLEVLAEDIREPVAEEKVGRLLVLAVDTSGSMGARQRAEAARRTVLAVLLDAYQRRDRVGVVTFGGQGAAVALAPTGSIEVARARLADMPTGGRTPLAEGILLAHDLATRSRRVPAGHPLLAVVSDGHATEGPDGRDPFEAALEAAGQVRLRGTPAVVFDAETGPRRLGLARELAEAMGARHLPIDALGPEALSS
jgi:magnesium chelatase subunit D